MYMGIILVNVSIIKIWNVKLVPVDLARKTYKSIKIRLELITMTSFDFLNINGEYI
jgi:hypothetical protein